MTKNEGATYASESVFIFSHFIFTKGFGDPVRATIRLAKGSHVNDAQTDIALHCGVCSAVAFYFI